MPMALKINKVNIFCRPEEAILWPGETLPSTGTMFCSREKFELCSDSTEILQRLEQQNYILINKAMLSEINTTPHHRTEQASHPLSILS